MTRSFHNRGVAPNSRLEAVAQTRLSLGVNGRTVAVTRDERIQFGGSRGRIKRFVWYAFGAVPLHFAVS